MRRFATLVIVAMVFMGTAMVISDAEAVPCVNVDNVTGLGSAGCTLGGLQFFDFLVSPTGVVAEIGLGNLSKVTATSTDLTFQVAHQPSPANLDDILLYYSVKTLTGAAQIAGVDLHNPGSNVTIREHVCSTPFSNGVCTGGGTELADLTAVSNSIAFQAFVAPVSEMFVRKDIQLLQNSFISEFTNSHMVSELTPTPEPATLLLLGSSLAAAGMAARKRMRRAAPVQSA